MAQRAEQSRAVEKRESILRAATEILLAEGLREVTHRQVAARAGVPVGSIGYYYASREKLLMTCLTRMAEHRAIIAAEQLEQASPDDGDVLVARRLVDSLTAGRTQDLPGLIGVLIDGLREPGELPALMIELYAESMVSAEKILDASGVSRDAMDGILDTLMGTILRSRLETHDTHPSVVEAAAMVIARHR
ncbi:TetR/AcrR family transcriptional regulator [Corynebacterium cystitidis]|uniref:Transcriptional regulator, TetR family n=1 Tax=Corynebacterium cystitidis DSM 20524 TaxID=1121357 RepID=A0A1H9SS46_9CORY|nr:TetR family transcriptional regulator [Corynebacterium cystitidis]WJY83159.1 putative DNA-binding transcriptional regulator [Corynebacterium cystitidis DSM 20524]SER87688.1 transcriptional regulator, TetR family [Corynebacterium cystitidis DSM 20524]SNV66915.1 TetR family transcriptional regulator [Corynebacterium cystitidis]